MFLRRVAVPRVRGLNTVRRPLSAWFSAEAGSDGEAADDAAADENAAEGEATEEAAGEGKKEAELPPFQHDGKHVDSLVYKAMNPEYPDPKADRRIPEIRNHPIHQHWGGLMDIMEHDIYVARVRSSMGIPPGEGKLEDYLKTDEAEEEGDEGEEGSELAAPPSPEEPDVFGFDATAADDNAIDEDHPLLLGGHVTEDEYYFDEEFEPKAHIPDRLRDHIYFLYTVKGWTQERISTKYRIRKARVSAIINFKRTEPEFLKQGMSAPLLDDLMSEMYGGRFQDLTLTGADATPQDETADVDEERNTDQGVQVEMLQDDMDPEDVVPQLPFEVPAVRLNHGLRKVAMPPKSERVMASRYSVTDISGRANSRRPIRLVDWDGSVRPATMKEELYRSDVPRYWIPPRKGVDEFDFPKNARERINVFKGKPYRHQIAKSKE